MHLLYEVLNRRTRMHAVRTQKRMFKRFLGRGLTMHHRGERAGRFSQDSRRLRGVGREAQIQLGRSLKLTWDVRR